MTDMNQTIPRQEKVYVSESHSEARLALYEYHHHLFVTPVICYCKLLENGACQVINLLPIISNLLAHVTEIIVSYVFLSFVSFIIPNTDENSLHEGFVSLSVRIIAFKVDLECRSLMHVLAESEV